MNAMLMVDVPKPHVQFMLNGLKEIARLSECWLGGYVSIGLYSRDAFAVSSYVMTIVGVHRYVDECSASDLQTKTTDLSCKFAWLQSFISTVTRSHRA